MEQTWSRRARRLAAFLGTLTLLTATLSTSVWTPRAASLVSSTGGDWPTYLHDPERNANAVDETTLSPSNAAQMTKLWSFQTGAPIAASASIVGGVVYVGSWDGYEYALDAKTGAMKWKTYLGQTLDANCQAPIGITSTAAIQNGVLYVGGGDAYWYALDASTGTILWKVFTGDNSRAGGHYNWSSPLLYNGFAYIGVASLGDCPLVQGQLIQVNLATHQVVNTFNLVPTGHVGGGIWTSPSVDPTTNTIFVTTGTRVHRSDPYAQSIVSFDANTLAVKGFWTVPVNQLVVDADWGDTPLIYDDASGRHMVAAVSKNGIAYAFDRNNLSSGPVWQDTVEISKGNVLVGDGTVSSGTFANNTLYFAGGNTDIGGTGFPGNVRAFDPATGRILWEHGSPGIIFAALAYANGLVFAGGGATFEVLDATTGTRLYSYTTGAMIDGAPSVSNGEVFAGSVDGKVYAFGLPSTPPPTPPADSNCPAGWTCQDIGAPSPAGSESAEGSTWYVTASGSGVATAPDRLRLIAQQASGDLRVSAQVSWPQSPGPAMGGVMVRQSADPQSPFYAVFTTPGSGETVEYRRTFGGATTTLQNSDPSAPPFVEIVRVNDTFEAATSTDGGTYTAVPGTVVRGPAMPASVLAGVATSSGGDWPTAVTYSGVTVAAPGAMPAAVPSATPCPSGWSCADIGDPAPVGDQSLSNGTWSISGGGAGVDGYSDQFHFVWQPVNGDSVISARVVSQTGTATDAKAGVILRQSTDPGSTFYGIFMRPSGLVVQYRDWQGLHMNFPVVASASTPTYLKVARTGNSFSAYTSPDGSHWTLVPNSTITAGITGPTLAGLAVTSHQPSAALDVASFDSVSISGGSSTTAGCPTQTKTTTGTASSKSHTFSLVATGTAGCATLSWTGSASLQISIYDSSSHKLGSVTTGISPETLQVKTKVGKKYKIKVKASKGTAPFTLVTAF